MAKLKAGELVLHQFDASHYNEKARWALDYKGVAHRRVTHLPGPHMLSLRRLSGQTGTPVLQTDSKLVVGSAAIIEHLERSHPTPALYPVNATDRSRALELQRSWDLNVGPATRTLLWAAARQEPAFLTSLFAGSKNALTRAIYGAFMKVASTRIADINGGGDPKRITKARDVVATSLDWLAANINASGQLITSGFTVADLSCAALLRPLMPLRDSERSTPLAVPASVAALHAEYRDHPAIVWANEQYARHRGG